MFLLLIATVTLMVVGFIFLHPVFGGTSGQDSLTKMQSSKYFRDGTFSNLVATTLSTRDQNSSSYWVGIKSMLFPGRDKNPQGPLPSQKFNHGDLKNDQFVWLGHSTILFNLHGNIILADPVFHRASPIPVFGKAFQVENKTEIEDLPPIDAVIISHDHYDHLDYKSITKLAKHVKKFFVPLGIKAHLLRWNVDESKITELDWYQSTRFNDIDFTLTPTRHFSGRSFTDGNKTLWGAWVIAAAGLKVYFGGDTGYFDEFKNIGTTYGPFDIAFLENGAYNRDWAQIHMTPEQSVQAGIDLSAKVLFPIHWSKFDLSFHVWDEPIKRFTQEAKQKNVPYTTPLIGQVFSLQHPPRDPWWEKIN